MDSHTVEKPVLSGEYAMLQGGDSLRKHVPGERAKRVGKSVI